MTEKSPPAGTVVETRHRAGAGYALQASRPLVWAAPQETLITQAYRDYNNEGFALVGLNLFELEHFRGKLLALMFYKGILPLSS